jgi:hypothetical protein
LLEDLKTSIDIDQRDNKQNIPLSHIESNDQYPISRLLVEMSSLDEDNAYPAPVRALASVLLNTQRTAVNGVSCTIPGCNKPSRWEGPFSVCDAHKDDADEAEEAYKNRLVAVSEDAESKAPGVVRQIYNTRINNIADNLDLLDYHLATLSEMCHVIDSYRRTYHGLLAYSGGRRTFMHYSKDVQRAATEFVAVYQDNDMAVTMNKQQELQRIVSAVLASRP